MKIGKFTLTKKQILPNIPVFVIAYVANKFCSLAQTIEGEISDKVLGALINFGSAFLNPLPSFNLIDIVVGIAAGGLCYLILADKRRNAKKYRQGKEYGSARWGTQEDIRPYIDEKNFENNILLTQTERLTMESRPKSGAKFARNKNILVIGGSGSGKTRFFVKPNLMQMHSSYIVTDPKGTVLIECGKMLSEVGHDNFVITGVKVVEGINKKGKSKTFVQMPSYQTQTGEYSTYANPITTDMHKIIQNKVLTAYRLLPMYRGVKFGEIGDKENVVRYSNQNNKFAQAIMEVLEAEGISYNAKIADTTMICVKADDRERVDKIRDDISEALKNEHEARRIEKKPSISEQLTQAKKIAEEHNERNPGEVKKHKEQEL